MEFRVWAPAAHRVVLHCGADPDSTSVPMSTSDGQWWSAQVERAGHGTDYGFSLDGDERVLPDPRSRWQPGGVHGRSRVYDHGRFAWGDAAWTGRQLPGAVVYELHVGTFT